MKFKVHDEGTICILFPQDTKADLWVAEMVAKDTLTWGCGLVIENGHAAGVLQALCASGATIEDGAGRVLNLRKEPT